MSVDIFQFDWIFIDTIIIVLLILLLICVKIYKKTHRWRSSFSNENLSIFSYSAKQEDQNDHLIKIKSSSLIRNNLIEKNHLPVIFIINSSFKKRLIDILIEGLGSYGFNIINTRVKLRKKSLSNQEKRELYSLILNRLSFFKEKNLLESRNYVLLDYINPYLPFDHIFSDKNNDGIILINPKLNKLNPRDYKDLIFYFDSDNRLFTIFSKHSIFLLRNKNLQDFLEKTNLHNKKQLKKLLIIENARKTFRFYETILLGIIIDIIEKNN